MLSDERIRQFVDDIYYSDGTQREIEYSIRAALAEAAQVPVTGEPTDRQLFNVAFNLSAEFGPEFTQANKAFAMAAIEQYRHAMSGDSITQAELDALLGSERMAMKEASDLAMAMWRDFFQEASPNLGLCDSPAGVLSQIDNMYAGLRERIQLQDARIVRQHRQLIEEMARTEAVKQELDAKDARIRELEAAALDVCMAGSYESARLAVIQLNTVLRRPAKEHQS